MKLDKEQSVIIAVIAVAAVLLAVHTYVPPSQTTYSSATSYTCIQSTVSGSNPAMIVSLCSGVYNIGIPQGAGAGLNFEPATLTCTAAPTCNITFRDYDTVANHQVVFLSGPSGVTLPTTSPVLSNGSTYTIILTTPGTYTYHCSFHPAWMQGTIIVQ